MMEALVGSPRGLPRSAVVAPTAALRQQLTPVRARPSAAAAGAAPSTAPSILQAYSGAWALAGGSRARPTTPSRQAAGRPAPHCGRAAQRNPPSVRQGGLESTSPGAGGVLLDGAASLKSGRHCRCSSVADDEQQLPQPAGAVDVCSGPATTAISLAQLLDLAMGPSPLAAAAEQGRPLTSPAEAEAPGVEEAEEEASSARLPATRLGDAGDDEDPVHEGDDEDGGEKAAALHAAHSVSARRTVEVFASDDHAAVHAHEQQQLLQQQKGREEAASTAAAADTVATPDAPGDDARPAASPREAATAADGALALSSPREPSGRMGRWMRKLRTPTPPKERVAAAGTTADAAPQGDGSVVSAGHGGAGDAALTPRSAALGAGRQFLGSLRRFMGLDSGKMAAADAAAVLSPATTKAAPSADASSHPQPESLVWHDGLETAAATAAPPRAGGSGAGASTCSGATATDAGGGSSSITASGSLASGGDWTASVPSSDGQARVSPLPARAALLPGGALRGAEAPVPATPRGTHHLAPGGAQALQPASASPGTQRAAPGGWPVSAASAGAMGQASPLRAGTPRAASASHLLMVSAVPCSTPNSFRTQTLSPLGRAWLGRAWQGGAARGRARRGSAAGRSGRRCSGACVQAALDPLATCLPCDLTSASLGRYEATLHAVQSILDQDQGQDHAALAAMLASPRALQRLEEAL